MIFVFGSNEAGRHGAGAARVARTDHGAIYGVGFGHFNNSFAIPTKDLDIQTLPSSRVHDNVVMFIMYAHRHPELEFKVTRIGCGLAGFTDKEIAPMFFGAPDNCYFDSAWSPYLGAQHKYWGTV